ncbi:sulfotransferase family protein [Acaryochloris thomasi]|uniref:sulfotransferase family protein n=1 Tax=Acaryochloris thomasi TaxID=2929456 RepID=UPI0013147538|nr:sulfotransferase [Acaryochloris thomasi]
MWIAPEKIKIPDFIICGAMKSGTTTLHHVLDQHPDIYIPEKEIHFFDIDNLLEHPDFFLFKQGQWISQDIHEDPEKFWRWYARHFAAAQAGQMIGEDSTVYLSSKRAAQRIALQPKDIKVVVMLRHPTSRAYSQYWHMLRTGRAVYDFEQMIQYDPYSVLGRSMYYEQLEDFLRYIPRARIKIVLFEEFIANKAQTVRSVCEHVGVDFEALPTAAFKSHENSARIPKYLKIQILRNKWFRQLNTINYGDFLPTHHGQSKSKFNIPKIVNKAHRLINPLTDSRPPKMRASTKQFLDDFFKKELAGLDELLGQELLSLWFD